jgi:hypothetical protein
MSEAANGEPQRRRPHSKPAAGPYLELDLTVELEGQPIDGTIEFTLHCDPPEYTV